MMSRCFVCFLLCISFIIPHSLSYAKTVTVEATGTYLIGDGPNENISIAKARAREDAMRIATEQVGVYIESYSKTQNSILTHDEITVVAAQVLQITEETMTPKITEENHILWICKIRANIDDSSIDINKIMSNKDAVEKSILLEKKIEQLQKENTQLKKLYNTATNESERNRLSEQIQRNEENFSQAVYSLPIYSSHGWRAGIDVDSIQYDKNSGIVSFTSTEINKKNGNKGVMRAKIYTQENAFYYLGMTVFPADGSKPFALKGAGSKVLEPIEPDSLHEKYQKKLYNYLGITGVPVNNPSNWQYVTTLKFPNGEENIYYIDVNNIAYNNDIIRVYTKCHSTQYGDSTGTDYFDFSNKRIGYFSREAGKIIIERSPQEYQWQLYRFVDKLYNEHLQQKRH